MSRARRGCACHGGSRLKLCDLRGRKVSIIGCSRLVRKRQEQPRFKVTANLTSQRAMGREMNYVVLGEFSRVTQAFDFVLGGARTEETADELCAVARGLDVGEDDTD